MKSTLPRAAWLGIALDAVDGGQFKVAHVIAEESGFAAGDILLRIGEIPIRTRADIQRALRTEADELEIETSRGVHVMHVRRKPCEPGAIYGAIESNGVKLRTITTGTGTRGILYVQGLGDESVDRPDAIVASLARDLAERGIVMTRVEKRGVGDSEGERRDFETDTSDVRAALASMETKQVFVLGHSVGGMIAPRLSGMHGIITYGSSAVRWRACLEASYRRQSELRKRPVPEVKLSSYEEEIDALDLAGLWTRVKCPRLALRGEWDWVVGDDDQRSIAHDFEIVPKLDHWMTRHETLEDSLARPGAGTYDGALAARIAAFLDHQSTS